MIPSWRQYKKWSLPAKVTYISGILAVLGFAISIYLGWFKKSSNSLESYQLEQLASMFISKVLEGSQLCCDIKTAEVQIYMPPEGKILIPASVFIGFMPDIINQQQYSFAYSVDPADSTKIFDCKMVGTNDLYIYFFKDQKSFCSKPGTLILKDPELFCPVFKRK